MNLQACETGCRYRPAKLAGMSQPLYLSSIGIGTYLGDTSEKTDKLVEDAIVNSVLSGTNVLDTAINYRNQRAEKSMGRALGTLRKMGTDRSEVFISSKVSKRL